MDDAGAARGTRNRLSDEVKEKDNKMFKKKSGLSSFFNLSSPRRPPISAPENPVHVTHVGYDQETGEFTVGSLECEKREMQAWMALSCFSSPQFLGKGSFLALLPPQPD